MLETSIDFKNAIQSQHRVISAYVVLDGVTYSGDSVVDINFNHGVIGDSYNVGMAVSAYARITLVDVDRSVDADGKIVEPYVGVEVDESGTIEYLKLATLYVDDSDRDLNRLTLHAFDKMVQLEQPYESTLTYPALLTDVLAEVLTGHSHDITLPSYLTDYQVTQLQGRTKRQVLGYIAALVGGFSYVDRVSSEIKLKTPSNTPHLDHVQTISGDTYFSLGVANPLTLTGLKLSNGSDTWTAGTTSGYVLMVDNPFASESVITNLYNLLEGMPMMTLNLKYNGNHALELGDSIEMVEFLSEEESQTRYANIGQTSIVFGQGLQGEIRSVGEGKQKNANPSNGELTNGVKLAKRNADAALDLANNAMQSSNGKNKVYFQPTEPSGGTYQDGDVWFETDNGNKIYIYNSGSWVPAALGSNAIADGAVVNRLIASGIDAGKITTGLLSASRIEGGTLKIGGQNDTKGKIEIVDGADILTGSINNGAIYLYGNNRPTGSSSRLYQNSNATIDYGLHLYHETGNPVKRDAVITVGGSGGNLGRIGFGTAPAGSDSEQRMVIDDNGFVGIGVTNPSSKLHINTYNADYAIAIQASNVSSSHYKMGVVNNSNDFAFSYYTPTSTLPIAKMETSGVFRVLNRLVVDGASAIQKTDVSGFMQFVYNGANYGLYYNKASYSSLSHVIEGSTHNTMGWDGSGLYYQVPSVYARTTSSAANVFVSTAGTLVRSTSATKYKLDIEPKITDDRILQLKPKTWYDKHEVETNAEILTKEYEGETLEVADTPYIERHAGLIAEDLVEVGLCEYVSYGQADENGNREVEGIQYDRLWVELIPIIKKQQEQIDELRKEIEILKKYFTP